MEEAVDWQLLQIDANAAIDPASKIPQRPI